MEIDGLPIIGPGVDYTQVRAIHQKRTLAFINHFILNTVAFLNKFSRSCELRFEKFEAKIQKLEASLSILEAKLASISGLEKVSKPIQHVEQKLEELHDVTLRPSTDPSISSVSIATNVEAEVVQSETNHEPPRNSQYTRFFRMVEVGVPIQAVRLKMKAEGLDPNILESGQSAIRVQTKVDQQNTSDSDSTAGSFSD